MTPFCPLSELEFSRDSTELKQVWLCARCSFISFGANERTKENIHLLQDLPLYGEDVIDFGQRPPSIKVLA